MVSLSTATTKALVYYKFACWNFFFKVGSMFCTDVCKWVSYPIAGYLGPWSLSQNGKIWSFDLCTFHTHTHTWIQVRPSSYRTKWCRHRTSKYTMGDFPKHFIHLYTLCDLTKKKQILRNRLYTYLEVQLLLLKLVL